MSATPVQVELAEKIDEIMLDVLKNGQVVIDEQGQPQKITPSAAMLNAIRARVKDLGIQSPTAPGTAAGSLEQEAAARGLTYKGRKIPLMDDNENDAATGTDD